MSSSALRLAFALAALNGKIDIFDNMRQTMGVALVFFGLNLNSLELRAIVRNTNAAAAPSTASAG